jgi:hypothetical protein
MAVLEKSHLEGITKRENRMSAIKYPHNDSCTAIDVWSLRC